MRKKEDMNPNQQKVVFHRYRDMGIHADPDPQHWFNVDDLI